MKRCFGIFVRGTRMVILTFDGAGTPLRPDLVSAVLRSYWQGSVTVCGDNCRKASRWHRSNTRWILENAVVPFISTDS